MSVEFFLGHLELVCFCNVNLAIFKAWCRISDKPVYLISSEWSIEWVTAYCQYEPDKGMVLFWRIKRACRAYISHNELCLAGWLGKCNVLKCQTDHCSPCVFITKAWPFLIVNLNQGHQNTIISGPTSNPKSPITQFTDPENEAALTFSSRPMITKLTNAWNWSETILKYASCLNPNLVLRNWFHIEMKHDNPYNSPLIVFIIDFLKKLLFFGDTRLSYNIGLIMGSTCDTFCKW